MILRTSKKILAADSAAAVIAAAGVFVAFSLINSRFLTRLDIDGIIVAASISAITGLGMTLVIAMRALDLSVGSIMGLAAIVAAQMLGNGVPLGVVIIAGLAVGCGVGLINGLLITMLGLPSFVATLATLSMILGVELLITQGQTITIHSSAFNKLVVSNICGFLSLDAGIPAAVIPVVWLLFC